MWTLRAERQGDRFREADGNYPAWDRAKTPGGTSPTLPANKMN